jgi:DNA repair exonuclease SbcCD ATPase subunit
LKEASDKVAAFQGKSPSERATLEMERDEKLRRMLDEDKRYQIAKDLADNLTIGYNTSEVIMSRLMQTTSAKERVFAQAVSFFSTNEAVLTALKASFTGMFGLHESTKTLEAMKKGVSDSLETLSEVGDAVTEEALKAGYGPTVRADAVIKLVDSVASFQERSREIIAEMRTLATRNSEEIREAVEAGKRRMARLAADIQALPPLPEEA